LKDSDHGTWIREPDGCSVVFGTEEKILLKLGMIVTVRYVVKQDKNMVMGFVLAREKTPEQPAGNRQVPCENTPLSEGSVEKIYSAGCPGFTPPECVYCPQPPYDAGARQNHVQGEVVVELVILTDGTVSDAKIVKSLDKGLDESALRTVRKYRFHPSIGPDGKPVKAKLRVEINFHLTLSPLPPPAG